MPSNNQNHYDTLGVSRKASLADIKQKFRQLSLRHHPDVAGVEATEKFQEISAAAHVLTCPTKRAAYDQTLASPHGLYNFDRSSSGMPRPGGQHGPAPTTPLQQFTEHLFRPRNLILGAVGVLAVTTAAAHFKRQQREEHYSTSQGDARLVRAWKNPQTGQWEQPAPWDPLYRQLQPPLELVPREQVRSRQR